MCRVDTPTKTSEPVVHASPTMIHMPHINMIKGTQRYENTVTNTENLNQRECRAGYFWRSIALDVELLHTAPITKKLD